jgi:hypothetical protein
LSAAAVSLPSKIHAPPTARRKPSPGSSCSWKPTRTSADPMRTGRISGNCSYPFGGSGYVALYSHAEDRDAVYILASRHQKEAGY